MTRSWSRLVDFLNRPLWTKAPSSGVATSRSISGSVSESVSSRKAESVSSSRSQVVLSQPVISEVDEVLVDTAALGAALEELAQLAPIETQQDTGFELLGCSWGEGR
ncbi:MAG: hypothetical protein HC936_09740 [Leptolyngbyaceae cyanobacterium SU_3_3]|nr:hypothetical protein [Leptolyngbyaceae cyanobacterium SU_3_3]